MSITPDELKILCDTTVKLVAVRQQNCPHVSVENIAPEIMGSLLAALLRAKARDTRDTAGSHIGYTEHEAMQAAKTKAWADMTTAEKRADIMRAGTATKSQRFSDTW